jgi:hypothetical protein
MIKDIFEFIVIAMFWDRIGRYSERRVARKGPYGVPVVTLVVAAIGAVAEVGLLLVERRINPSASGGALILPLALAGARLVLVVLVARGLRLGGTARRGGGVYMGIMLTEVVNLFIIIVDFLAVWAAGMGQAFSWLPHVGSDGLMSPRNLWALTVVAVVGLLSDMIIGFTLMFRRRMLD